MAEDPRDLAAARAWRERLRAEGRSLVLTNGVFDLLHTGHLRYLQAARAMGDALLVAVNTDASVRENKGPLRPVVPEDERAELVAGLGCVDRVLLFGDRTAEAVVAALEPDVYVKGADYADKPLPEAEIVAGYGGRVALVPLVEGRSTTSLIDRIRVAYG